MELAIETSILVNGLSERWGACDNVLGLISASGTTIALDREELILAAYRGRLDEEMFEKWSTFFSPQFAPRYSCNLADVFPAQATYLEDKGWRPDLEIVFVAVAAGGPKVLLTESSTFGKGRNGSTPQGKAVLKYLNKELNLHVYDATQALSILTQLLNRGLEGQLHARHFEVEVGLYLQRQGYSVEFQPPTPVAPKLGPADVLAAKRSGERHRVRLCECKLALSDDPADKYLQARDVKKLAARAECLRQTSWGKSRLEESLDLEAWLITNGSADEWAWQASGRTGVRLMTATLSKNWRTRSDWQVTKITSMIEPS